MQNQDLTQIYNKYNNLVYRIALTYAKNEMDAEDIMQDVFVKRLCYHKKFESEEHEKNWMIRVTINKSKDHLKSFWKKNRCDIGDLQQQVTWNMDQEKKQLLEELFCLPDKCRITLYLHYFEGYTCKEIAHFIHCGESAVKMRLKKGRDLLKQNLK